MNYTIAIALLLFFVFGASTASWFLGIVIFGPLIAGLLIVGFVNYHENTRKHTNQVVAEAKPEVKTYKENYDWFKSSESQMTEEYKETNSLKNDDSFAAKVARANKRAQS